METTLGNPTASAIGSLSLIRPTLAITPSVAPTRSTEDSHAAAAASARCKLGWHWLVTMSAASFLGTLTWSR
jgi:hypothetical protein